MLYVPRGYVHATSTRSLGRPPAPDTSPTREATAEACHRRCDAADGCSQFRFDADTGECHLISAAERGEEIILTRRGKPVARIVALSPTQLASRIDLAEDAARELLEALDALRQDLGLKREEERRD